jgi:predicted ATPase
LKNDLDQLETIRMEVVNRIYNKKREIVRIYESLKEIIDEHIKKYENLMKDYQINIEVSFKIDKDLFMKEFLKYINQKVKGKFKGKEDGYEFLKELIDNVEDFNNWENVKNFLNTLLRNLKEYEIAKQIEKLEDFFDYLFSLKYLEPFYELKLGSKSLSSLSPGERGALLIVFYLMLDKNDIPLIIDQPEENLDNESIYEILVHFIREVKKRRQIIIVTHNPNLAIVGDSEQIIYVEIDKQNGNEFRFKSGAIENPVINKECSKVLEGTMRAFDKRRLKYFNY